MLRVHVGFTKKNVCRFDAVAPLDSDKLLHFIQQVSHKLFFFFATTKTNVFFRMK